jgi:hypothetical protein
MTIRGANPPMRPTPRSGHKIGTVSEIRYRVAAEWLLNANPDEA